MTELVLEQLEAVPLRRPQGHHFGRPFLTAYQIAVGIDRDHPEVRKALGLDLGGRGTGHHDSFTRYVAHQLSRLIATGGEGFPIEGAFVSNRGIADLRFGPPVPGPDVVSSVSGGSTDLSMFRLRSPDRV